MIISFVLFIALILFVFYPVGLFFVRRIENYETHAVSFFVSVTIGIVFLTLLFFLTSLFQLRFIFYIVLTIAEGYFLFHLIKKPFYYLDCFKMLRETWIVSFSLLILTLVLSVVYLQYGNLSSGTFNIYGVHFADSMWHLALTQNIIVSIPPQNPGLYGVEVVGYHYFYDVFLGFVQIISHISLFDLYFRLLNPFLIFLLLHLVYFFVLQITQSSRVGFGAVLMSVVTSNMFYIVPLFYPQSRFSPSVMWIDEFTTLLVNPPLLLASSILLTFLFLFMHLKQMKFISLIVLAIIGGSLIGFKAYISILLLGALGIVAIQESLKREYKVLLLCCLTLFITLLLALSYLNIGSQVFLFRPFWFIEQMFMSKDHLADQVWILKRDTFLADANYLRILLLYGLGSLFYLIINFGFKLFGFFTYYFYRKSEYYLLLRVINAIAFFGLLLPFIFIQKSVVWNSIQFSYSSLFLLGILFSLLIHRIFKDSKKGFLAFGVVILLLSPGVYYSLNEYARPAYAPKIEDGIIESALFLRDVEENGILLHPKFTGNDLVPAISGKSNYFSEQEQLSSENHELYQMRRSETVDFLQLTYTDQLDFLRSNNLHYVLFPNDILKLNIKLIEVVKGKDASLFEVNY